MSKKLLNVEAVENAKRNQIDEIDGWKLGDEIWAITQSILTQISPSLGLIQTKRLNYLFLRELKS